MGTGWEQSENKIGPECKNKVGTKWEQSWHTRKALTIMNKVGAELAHKTSLDNHGTKWEQSENKTGPEGKNKVGTKVGTELAHKTSLGKVGTE